MINWISVKDETPEECCNGMSVRVLVCGVDTFGDWNWGDGIYMRETGQPGRWDTNSWQKITHWAYMPNLPEIK